MKFHLGNYLSLFLIFSSTIIATSVIAESHNCSSLNNNLETVETFHEIISYEQMISLFEELNETYSDIFSFRSLGKTYQGRDIWLVKISDNVGVDEEEPGVLLLGAHHGIEYPSYEVLVDFIKHIVTNYSKENTDDDLDGFVNEDILDNVDNDEDGLIDEDPSEDRVRDVVNNNQIFLIPMVNPDGVVAGTRKNCEPNYGPFGFRKKVTSIGVDLNRNYGYKWYRWFFTPFYYLMMSQLRDEEYFYRGERPFSEKETQAVKSFVESHNINISLSYHTGTNMTMYPWYYSMLPTRDESLYISVGSNLSKINMLRLVGRDYFLGYRGASGTYEDWAYGRHGILSFCIELPGIFTLDDFTNYYRAQKGANLYVCEIAGSINTQQRQMIDNFGGISLGRLI